jgi:metallo-beta-lactamase family protein
MHIQFFGAAGTVTGSNFLLSDDRRYGVLVDMGMFQGSAELEELNHKPLNFDAREVHSVFLTHAHLDHCGRLPVLPKHGFSGKAYMTQATKEIAEVVLRDAAKIMQHDKEKPVLYTKEDVFDFLNLAEVVSYGQELDLGNIKTTFRDAGHILGSASLEMQILDMNKKLAFSGDLGNSPEELVKPTEYIKNADVVIMESTYGDRNHPEDNPDETLIGEVNLVEKDRGTLLIPSFSVERTQALLYKINKFKKEGKINQTTTVYLDSPMGERVTEIYKKFSDLYSKELSEDFKTGDPFSFTGLKVIQNSQESQQIHAHDGPKVIIAGSGMMTGGRILSHAMHYLPDPTTRLLIVGFQAENTLGRALEEGVKNVNIDGKHVSVNAKITSLHSMSAHADQSKLLGWLGKISGTKSVFLVHGEDAARIPLQGEIKKLGIAQVQLPELNEAFEI